MLELDCSAIPELSVVVYRFRSAATLVFDWLVSSWRSLVVSESSFV